MAGVSGGNLGRRMRDIINAPAIQDLHGVQKAMLAVTAALTLALPIAGGLVAMPLSEPVRRQIVAVQMHAGQALKRGVAAMTQQVVLSPVPSRDLPPRVKLAAVAPVTAEPPSFTIAPAPAENTAAADMPVQPAQGATADQPVVTRVKVVNGEPDGRGEADHITCRAPQAVTGSRLRGPRICLTNREWAQMNQKGQILASDGSVEDVSASRKCTTGGLSAGS
jgi:hypothetical protein